MSNEKRNVTVNINNSTLALLFFILCWRLTCSVDGVEDELKSIHQELHQVNERAAHADGGR